MAGNTRVHFDAKKDYFYILSVTEDASITDISSAFRQLALSTHPDHLPPDASSKYQAKCNAEMQELTEARDVLLDGHARANWLMDRAELIKNKSNINNNRNTNQSSDTGRKDPSTPKRNTHYDRGINNEYFDGNSNHGHAQSQTPTTPAGNWKDQYWNWRREWEAAYDASGPGISDNRAHKRCYEDDEDYSQSDHPRRQSRTQPEHTYYTVQFETDNASPLDSNWYTPTGTNPSTSLKPEDP